MNHVDGGDYVSHIDEIGAISAIMKMAGAGPVLNSSIGKMPKLYDVIRNLWRFPDYHHGIDAQIRNIIQTVHQALIGQNLLAKTPKPDGTLSAATLAAIEKFWVRLGKQCAAHPTFPLAPRVFQAITEGAKPIRRTSNHRPDSALSELEFDSK
jgi:hypothetical protein